MSIETILTSGKVVQLRDLTARQLCNAELAADAAGAFGFPSSYYRTAMAVAKIDEVVYPLADTDVELEAVIDQLKAQDANELFATWEEHYGAKATAVNKNGIVKLSSGKAFAVRSDLTAREQMGADRCASFSPSATPYYRTAAMLQATVADVDGEITQSPLPAPDRENPKPEYDRRLDALSARDYLELRGIYMQIAGPNRHEVKNV